MQVLWQDVRYSLRTLRKNPGFTAVAVMTLALGIGANTALFSIVNAVLLRPLPYREPARIVQLWESNRNSRTVRVSAANFLDWRRQSRSFDQMAAYAGGPVTAAGGELPQRTTATAVTRDFFSVLGVNAIVGRTFLPGEHRAGGALTLGRVLPTLLYGVSATDASTYAGVSLLVAVVALIAIYISARRATRVDPILALRHE